MRFFREKGIRLILVYGSKIDAVFGDVIEYSHHNSNYDSLDRAIQRAFQLVGIDPPEIHVAKDEMHICASYMDLVKERSLAVIRLSLSASLPMSPTNSLTVTASISFCRMESLKSLMDARGVFSS